MSTQLLSLVGATCVLSAYGLAQTGRWNPRGWRSTALNVGGCLLLGSSAVLARNAGFILLNTVWALIALRSAQWKTR